MWSTRETHHDDDDAGLPKHNVLLAHAIVGALTAMLFIPITILLPRIARGFSLHRWWFPVHMSFASAALLGGIVTVALAKIGLGDADSHGSLGYALLVFLIAQVALGIMMKWYNHKHPRPPSRGRNPLNYVHIAVGILTIAVGWAAVYTGWSDQWPDSSGTGSVATVWKVLFWVVVGVVACFYIGGWVLLWPRQRRMEMAMTQSNSSSNIPLVQPTYGPGSHKPTTNNNGAY